MASERGGNRIKDRKRERERKQKDKKGRQREKITLNKRCQKF